MKRKSVNFLKSILKYFNSVKLSDNVIMVVIQKNLSRGAWTIRTLWEYVNLGFSSLLNEHKLWAYLYRNTCIILCVRLLFSYSKYSPKIESILDFVEFSLLTTLGFFCAHHSKDPYNQFVFFFQFKHISSFINHNIH